MNVVLSANMQCHEVVFPPEVDLFFLKVLLCFVLSLVIVKIKNSLQHVDK